MSARACVSVAAACLCLSLASCGGQDFGKRLPTIPVHGKVTVNGKPYADIYVFATPVEPAAAEKSGRKIHPGQKFGLTSETGEFTMTTYAKGDGLPEGKYKLTFRIEDLEIAAKMASNAADPQVVQALLDEFNKRFYKSTEQSQNEITVPAGAKTVEVEPIDLTI